MSVQPVNTLREYVVGFAFSHDMQRVLLIRKTHPEWQAGKLNGIGGRVDAGENQIAAMVREFREETGIYTCLGEWKSFARIEGDNIYYKGEIERDPNALKFRVWFFWAVVDDIDGAKSLTEEKLSIVNVEMLPWIKDHLVSAVSWLVPMAANWKQSRCDLYSIQEIILK